MTERKLMHDRRAFLRLGATLAAGLPLSKAFVRAAMAADAAQLVGAPTVAAGKVAIVGCKGYGTEIKTALKKTFDHLGGIGWLVKNKTVTVKLNLTGTNFAPFLGRPVGETYMTHDATALALGTILFESGASRVRFVESTNSRSRLENTLALADWDVNALLALGKVEFENTRNLGLGKSYAHLSVPGGGNLFSSFDLNHSYADTDVLISLAKLKQHVTTGVTLSMKNMFGLTPNSLYGSEAGSEEATEGRLPLHGPGSQGDIQAYARFKPPGLKAPFPSNDAGVRVPRIIVDLCAARPIHLAIIDGIASMSGAEGPWCQDNFKIKLQQPGVLIAGLNPVSTDAVATAVMGYSNPRAERGVHPFENCDNHLVLAEQAGLGTADLKKIEVLGIPLSKAVCAYG
jgi:uncharacterized protein (DUF362 family)